jgi:hypothetical protein
MTVSLLKCDGTHPTVLGSGTVINLYDLVLYMGCPHQPWAERFMNTPLAGPGAWIPGEWPAYKPPAT